MSKTIAFAIAALTFCFGLFAGVLVMSSDVENFKKEKNQAEAALKDATKRAEITEKHALQKELSLKTELSKTEYAKDQLSREVAVLEENLSKITKAETVEKSQLQKNNATVAEKEQWEEVARWTGKGIKNTETFHISSSTWRISWVTRAMGDNMGLLQIIVYSSDGSLVNIAANVMGDEDADSSVMRGSGDYYLMINTLQPYVVVVETK